MLTELYEYAQKQGLTARAGFKPKKIKAYLSLSADGKFLGIDPPLEETTWAPDIGAAANGTTKCNLLVEKANLALQIDGKPNTKVKHEFFKQGLRSGAGAEPLFGVCLRALEDPETLEAMRAALAERKIKPGDPVGFEVDGQKLEKSTKYYGWWETYRRQIGGAAQDAGQRCLITGGMTAPMRTVPKVSGLMAVGGHTAGDAFLCFDKDAFASYGLDHSENAVVSEAAMTSVNAALRSLIESAPILAGAKMLHWYKEPVEEKEDILASFFGRRAAGEKDNEEGYARRMDTALAAANQLITSAREGRMPQKLQNRYYIMPLSGASGRMMVRGWDEGSYETLYENIKAWFDDLRIVTYYGKGLCEAVKLSRLEYRLLKPAKAEKNISKRMADELAGLQPRLLYSILHNRPLPDEVGERALRYIRSAMLGSGDQKQERRPDLLACELLKAWIVRLQREKGGKIDMKETVNFDYPSTAYQCGRLMAVYAEIQKAALGDLNAGVVERYYTGASTAPAMVLGRLSSLSHYHLGKIENKGTRIYYQNMLDEISCNLTLPLPTSLTLQQQGEFALGYNQQHAEMYKSKKVPQEDTGKNSDTDESERKS